MNGPENGAADPTLWLDESPRPQSVIDAEAERLRAEQAEVNASGAGVAASVSCKDESYRDKPAGSLMGGAEACTSVPANHAASVPTAPRWPQLLQILLARLRGEQPFECCFLCLTSDDPKDCCAEHHDRLEQIMHYGEAAA